MRARISSIFNLRDAGYARKWVTLSIPIGIGAGIGSIFKAPLGGAILSMEILYRRD